MPIFVLIVVDLLDALLAHAALPLALLTLPLGANDSALSQQRSKGNALAHRGRRSHCILAVILAPLTHLTLATQLAQFFHQSAAQAWLVVG